MKILLFDHPQDVTQEELDKDLQQLPQWRREKALAYHFLIDQVLCTKAFLLLRQGLRELYGIDTNPEFDYTAHDKPVLRDFPDIHFNLSHCHSGVLCVIDSQPIGCDIEEVEKELDPNLCRHCFSDNEISDIYHSQDPCLAFTRMWTMKEAALKLTGEGITDDLPQLFLIKDTNKFDFHTYSYDNKKTIYTICKYKKQ